MSAFDHASATVIGQLATASKSNEIPTVRTLLATFDLHGVVVTVDALCRRRQAETAAEHGWGGVAGNMEQAVEHLEGVIEQLRTAEQSGQSAATVLDEITDQMSSPEVVEHLATAGGELDTVSGSLDAAVTLVDEAIIACEAAGQTSLPGAIQNLREEITEVRERAGQSRAETDAERQHAGTWADAVEEDEDAS